MGAVACIPQSCVKVTSDMDTEACDDRHEQKAHALSTSCCHLRESTWDDVNFGELYMCHKDEALTFAAIVTNIVFGIHMGVAVKHTQWADAQGVSRIFVETTLGQTLVSQCIDDVAPYMDNDVTPRQLYVEIFMIVAGICIGLNMPVACVANALTILLNVLSKGVVVGIRTVRPLLFAVFTIAAKEYFEEDVSCRHMQVLFPTLNLTHLSTYERLMLRLLDYSVCGSETSRKVSANMQHMYLNASDTVANFTRSDMCAHCMSWQLHRPKHAHCM